MNPLGTDGYDYDPRHRSCDGSHSGDDNDSDHWSSDEHESSLDEDSSSSYSSDENDHDDKSESSPSKSHSATRTGPIFSEEKKSDPCDDIESSIRSKAQRQSPTCTKRTTASSKDDSFRRYETELTAYSKTSYLHSRRGRGSHQANLDKHGGQQQQQPRKQFRITSTYHHKRRRHRHVPRWASNWQRFLDRLAIRLERYVSLRTLHRLISKVLWAAFVLWAVLVVLQYILLTSSQSRGRRSFRRGNGVRARNAHERVHILSHQELEDKMRERMHQDEQSPFHFWSDVATGFWDVLAPLSSRGVEPKKQWPVLPKKKPKERDLPGCVHEEWQKLNFPTCNSVHETDLRGAFVASQRRRKLRPHRHRRHSFNFTAPDVRQDRVVSGDTESSLKLGYLGSGLWRSVWAVNPGLEEELAVLKAMKREHDVDERNMQRHRRDALVMERLTSSPFVVDVYAFCGNAVLSEYIPTTIQDVIENDSRFSSNTTIQRKRLQVNATRETQEGRFKLALDIAQGLNDIHFSFPTGPIAHADLQTEQLLVTPSGRVKVNDFNRCRFIAHRQDNTSELCPFFIPSAPGKSRSPEEYSEKKLTQQIDVYSTANILYAVLTGEHPWHGMSVEDVKAAVRKGGRPRIYLPDEPDTDFHSSSSTDGLLARVIEKAYDVNPDSRITAGQMMQELRQTADAR